MLSQVPSSAKVNWTEESESQDPKTEILQVLGFHQLDPHKEGALECKAHRTYRGSCMLAQLEFIEIYTWPVV